MSILVVGSVALDTVETPFGSAEEVLGGSANYFAAAASVFGKVRVVGVVGDDYPMADLDFLVERGVDLSGVERRPGPSFFWKGRYRYDLNTRETISTRLGVFAEFRPRIPESFRDARLVFLGNIDPVQQLEVLRQVNGPELVACDTMDYWIEGSRQPLLELLSRVDVVLVNDAELRQLADEPNLLRGARWVQERGPDYVVVKKGEHGAILYARDWIFFAPGYPLEDVFDPTGAGDAFAGGFLGYLSGSGTLDPDEMRRAMIYGSATGSYAVERFSVERFRTLTPLEVAQRVEEFRDMTTFEHDLELNGRV
ncbi:MAG TPA: PfkB family carbohydrate kinase [Longimicrobiales bacterium]|nr:PfkB family carbohydrate kinase [Longimicrobiales bacterium]